MNKIYISCIITIFLISLVSAGVGYNNPFLPGLKSSIITTANIGGSGSNVSSVTSSTNCISVSPITGDVILTFNASCGGGGSADGNNYTLACSVSGTTTKTATCSRNGMTNYTYSWTDLDTINLTNWSQYPAISNINASTFSVISSLFETSHNMMFKIGDTIALNLSDGASPLIKFFESTPNGKMSFGTSDPSASFDLINNGDYLFHVGTTSTHLFSIRQSTGKPYVGIGTNYSNYPLEVIGNTSINGSVISQFDSFCNSTSCASLSQMLGGGDGIGLNATDGILVYNNATTILSNMTKLNESINSKLITSLNSTQFENPGGIFSINWTWLSNLFQPKEDQRLSTTDDVTFKNINITGSSCGTPQTICLSRTTLTADAYLGAGAMALTATTGEVMQHNGSIVGVTQSWGTTSTSAMTQRTQVRVNDVTVFFVECSACNVSNNRNLYATQDRWISNYTNGDIVNLYRDFVVGAGTAAPVYDCYTRIDDC